MSRHSRLRWILFTGLLLIHPLLATGAGLTLGIFPRFNPAQTRDMFTPLVRYLEQGLGQPIELKVSHNYRSFTTALQSGRFDIVHSNQYDYIRAHKAQGYQAIVRNEEGGSDTLHGVVMVRADSGITQVEQLRGKRIIFGGGPAAMISYIVPRQLLQQHGLQNSDYQPLFARTPPNAILAAHIGEADAAGASEQMLHTLTLQQMIDTSEMRVLARGEPLAHLPWAVHARLGPDLRQQIQSLLLALRQSIAGQAILRQAGLTGLVTALDSDYAPHRAIVAEVMGEHY